MEKDIPISYIFFWIGIAIILSLSIWWVLGSSPTIENLSLGLGIFGFIITWIGLRSSNSLGRAMNLLYKENLQQTEMLKTLTIGSKK